MVDQLVSIIIPTYNRKEKLLLTINSVIMQSWENIEIIIIDDCSDDGTQKVVKSINDKRIVYELLLE